MHVGIYVWMYIYINVCIYMYVHIFPVLMRPPLAIFLPVLMRLPLVIFLVLMRPPLAIFIINFSFHIGSKEDVGKRNIVRTIGTASFGRSL